MLENTNTKFEKKKSIKNKSSLKKKLQLADTKKRKGCKSNKQGTRKNDPTSSWYCFMCDECVEEEIICYRDCKKWVHVDCAGTDDNFFFVCELCSSF